MLVTVTRRNNQGIIYSVTEMENRNTTMIAVGQKKILVGHTIERILVAWYNWQGKREPVQTAFSFLSSGEREFLISGTTEQEFDELFPDEE